jgi:hypothetical protein
MATEIRAFQIFYNEKTRALLDRGFEALDNSRNERPDWFEYWPVRNFLSQNPLDDSTLYGFLSPGFRDKTNLTSAQVRDFLLQAGDADVVTFSPYPCHAACFVNIFEHGDFFHQGLYEAAERFLREWDPAVRLDRLVMHSRNTVFCNFFFAKPRFWKAWQQVSERLFELAETRSSPLYPLLTRTLDYVRDDGLAKPAHMKIFVMERLVSYLLATNGFVTRNFPPFDLPLTPAFVGRMPNLVVFDALKMAFSQTGDARFLNLYKQLRNEALAAVWPGHKPRL